MSYDRAHTFTVTSSVVNPTMLTLFRAGGGSKPPSGFYCAITKRRKTESSYSVTFPKHSLRIFWQKIAGSGQVRSPQAVCWHHFRKVCSHPRARVFGFFVNSLKTAARSAAVFGTPYHTSVPHMLCKFQTQATQGQVTRSRQVTSPHKKFECSSTLHRLNDSLETFRDCY